MQKLVENLWPKQCAWVISTFTPKICNGSVAKNSIYCVEHDQVYQIMQQTPLEELLKEKEK